MEFHPHYDPTAIASVCRALVKARWIAQLPVEAESGGLSWTELGWCRRNLLIRVIGRFGLTGQRNVPLDFTFACRDAQGDSTRNFEEAARTFWMACLQELSLPADENQLWTFVGLLSDESRPNPVPAEDLAAGLPQAIIEIYGARRRNS